MFVTQLCLQIQGSGFTENTKLTLAGLKVGEDFFISTPTKIFVCDKMETLIMPIVEKRLGTTIKLGDAGDSTAYEFKNDPEYQTEIEWEETSAKEIHNFLAGAEGQLENQIVRQSLKAGF